MAVASHPSSQSSQQSSSYAHNFYNHSQQQRQQQQHQPSNFIFASAPNQSDPVQSWSQPPHLVPRSAPTPSFTFSSPTNGTIDEVPLPLDQVPELMNDHHWQASQPQQHFSTSRGLGGLPAHQRNSSLSTLNSAGPSSPYTQSTANPQIAITDSASDGFPDVSFQDAPGLYGGKQQDSFYSHYPTSFSHGRNNQQARSAGTLLPPPEFQFAASSNPVSVASSIASDSPATPCMDDQQPASRRRKQQLQCEHNSNHDPDTKEPSPPPLSSHHHPLLPLLLYLREHSSDLEHDAAFNPSVPKLDRTMTDVYSDELYNPSFSITTTTVSPSTPTSAVSPNSDLFNQRIHAANSQHLSAAHSPATTISRERSPFRHGSPLATLSHNFSNNNAQRMPAASHQDVRFPSSQHHIKSERDAAATTMMHHQQQQQMASRQPESESVKTISPKDAMLEFSEPGDAANFPLFPQHDGSHHFMGLGDASAAAHTAQNFGSIRVTSAHDNSFAGFIPSTLPDQYHHFMPRSDDAAGEMHHHHLPTDVHQLQQQQQQQQPQQMQTPTSPQKPASSNTDRGAFSCTYQGCPLRFETAALLQKHKREGHRQAHGFGAGRRDTSMTPGMTSTQNGPHKCTQINPSTGKPCNTEFSRPYDLTRHEDTIHNPKKKKVTCPACTDKKQFSRGDALSRHYRVCHPDLTPPGKRRGGATRG